MLSITLKIEFPFGNSAAGIREWRRSVARLAAGQREAVCLELGSSPQARSSRGAGVSQSTPALRGLSRLPRTRKAVMNFPGAL